MSKSTTIKLQKYFRENRRKPDRIICTIERLAEHMGMSYQWLYVKLKNHKWSRTDVFAISKIIPETNFLKGAELTKMVLNFLKEQKDKRRQGYVTKKQIAKKLNMSVSLLYKRCDKHNWTKQETELINSL